MANIIITTHWTDGDVIPFINIGEYLQKEGHDVVVFTHCYYKHTIIGAGLTFEAWDDVEHYQMLIESMRSGIDSNLITIDNFRNNFENNDIRISEYNKIFNYCTNPKNTIIIAKNRSSISALMIAEKLNIPIIYVFMSPYELVSMINFEEIYGEKILPEMNLLRKKINLKPINSWIKWQCAPKINVGLWPKWFCNKNFGWNSKIIPIGFPTTKNIFVNTKKINEIIPDWNLEKIPVLISGGTSKFLDPNFYKICIEACKLLDIPTIVLTKYKELLPHKLPHNIKWFEYLPLNKLLPFIGVIIHHGGINTLSSSLIVGFPQVILAHYVDRPFNAQILKKLNIAEYLPPIKWTPIKIGNSIKTSMSFNRKQDCISFSNSIYEENSFVNIKNIVDNITNNSNTFNINFI